MMISSKARFTILLFAFLASPVLAENNSSWNSAIIISAGQSSITNACTSPWVIPDTTCSEGKPVLRLAYVYHFSKTWGLEISGGQFGLAESYGSLTIPPAPATGPASYDWQLQASGLAIAGVGTIHLGSSLSLFGKAGILYGNLSEEWNLAAANGAYYGITMNGVPITDRKITSLTYGAGIQIDFSRAFALRAQYENFGTYDIYSAYGNPTAPEVEISLLSAGLVLKF